MQTIMVQVTDHQQTLATLHFACAMALNIKARIVLVKMLPAQYPGWLGTEMGSWNFTGQDQSALNDYQATAEDYGVEVTGQIFQYLTMPEAIADAADYVDAQFVFATIPSSAVPFLRKFKVWALRKRLSQHGRQLLLSDQNQTSQTQVPSLLVSSVSKRSA